jgi:aryl-phospho-beta-D-glucosidase BglC (GH1 family)
MFLFIITVLAISISSVAHADDMATLGVGNGVTPLIAPVNGPAVDINFAAGMYAGGTLITDTRGSPATTYATTLTGSLTSFAPNTPRITNQGMLIEESRSNLINYSNLTSGFVQGGGTTTAGAATSPDGTTDAAFFKLDTSTGNHYIEVNSYGTIPGSAVTYTLSFYAKRVGSQPLNLWINYWDGSFGGNQRALIDLGRGGAEGTNYASCTIASSTAYWRCSWTFTSDGVAGIYLQFQMLNATTGGAETDPISFKGDGASGLYLYGFQLEAGSFPTSIIPTLGSTVTRSADVVTINGAAATGLNAATGTAVIETNDTQNYGSAASLIDSNGTALLGFTTSDTLSDDITSSTPTTNTGNRWLGKDYSSVAWDPSGRTIVLDGGAEATDAVAQTPSSTLHLGSNGSANFLDGYVSRLRIWNTKLATPETQFPLLAGTPNFIIYVAGPENYRANSYFPTTGDWNYLQGKGFNTVRLTVAWENIQPTLASALDSTFLTAIQNALSNAASRGMTVVVDIQNYGHYVTSAGWTSGMSGGNFGNACTYCFAIGSVTVPISDFTDLWTRLATALAGTPGLGAYELMNEPSGLPSVTTWPIAAQDAINAIRAIDARTPIWVAGDGTAYSAGFTTARWSPPAVTGTNLVYTAHTYFDAGEGQSGGGTYSNLTTTGTYAAYSIDNYTGVRSIQSFLGWLKMNAYRGVVGEFGIPNSSANNNAQWFPTQLHVMSNLVQYGVPGVQTFYGANSAGAGSNLYYNPVSGVDDPRLLQMLGDF